MKFSRQIRVIGREGQKKLESSEIVVARGAAGEIQARYLVAAGARVREGSVSFLEDARFSDMHAAARDVALGAHAAAIAIMNVVRS